MPVKRTATSALATVIFDIALGDFDGQLVFSQHM